MSQEAKLTRVFRRRSQKSGEWLVTRNPGVARTKDALEMGAFDKRTAARRADETGFEESAVAEDREGAAEEVLMISAENPATLDRIQCFFRLLEDRLFGLEEAQMLRLIDLAMPALPDRPPAEAIDQVRRNAQARSDFLCRYEVLEAEDVHTLYGSLARNKAALAARWRAEGKVFAIEDSGRLVYPAFQFDGRGRPKPIIADVLPALGANVGAWQIALWLVSPNGWLDGARPIDRLDDDGKRVLEAARDVADPVIQ